MISTWEVPEQWSIAVQDQEQGVSYWLTTAYWPHLWLAGDTVTPVLRRAKTVIGSREFAVNNCD